MHQSWSPQLPRHRVLWSGSGRNKLKPDTEYGLWRLCFVPDFRHCKRERGGWSCSGLQYHDRYSKCIHRRDRRVEYYQWFVRYCRWMGSAGRRMDGDANQSGTLWCIRPDLRGRNFPSWWRKHICWMGIAVPYHFRCAEYRCWRELYVATHHRKLQHNGRRGLSVRKHYRDRQYYFWPRCDDRLEPRSWSCCVLRRWPISTLHWQQQYCNRRGCLLHLDNGKKQHHRGIPVGRWPELWIRQYICGILCWVNRHRVSQ